MVRRLACFLICLALAGMDSQADASESQGVGLRVTPAALFVQNVFLGKLYDVYEESGIRLTIHNLSDRERTYLLSTHIPSDVGVRRWLQGYAEVPDLSWFWFDQQEHRLLMAAALEVVQRCDCGNGCPACVGPVAEVGPHGKETALRLLVHLAGGPGPRAIAVEDLGEAPEDCSLGAG